MVANTFKKDKVDYHTTRTTGIPKYIATYGGFFLGVILYLVLSGSMGFVDSIFSSRFSEIWFFIIFPVMAFEWVLEAINCEGPVCLLFSWSVSLLIYGVVGAFLGTWIYRVKQRHNPKTTP